MAAQHGLEDISFTENSPLFPIHEKHTVVFKGTHRCLYAYTTPTVAAFPFDRRRVFGANVANAALIFTGGDESDLSVSFAKFVGRTLKVDGSAFLLSSDGDRLEMLKEWMRKRPYGEARARRLSMTANTDDIITKVSVFFYRAGP